MSAPLALLLHVRVQTAGIDERLSVALDQPISLGRDAECDVELPSATVSRRHVSLFARQGRLMVRDHSSNGTRVNGEHLHSALREVGQRAALEVGPYAIELRLASEGEHEAVPGDLSADVVEDTPAPTAAVLSEAVKVAPVVRTPVRVASTLLGQASAKPLVVPVRMPSQHPPPLPTPSGPTPSGPTPSSPTPSSPRPSSPRPSAATPSAPVVPVRPVDRECRRKIRAQLLDSLDLVALQRGPQDREPEAREPENREPLDAAKLRPRVDDALERIMEGYAAELPSGPARQQLRAELCDEVLGLGPLEPLLRDPSVSEIMLVDAATIYVERAGRIERTAARFTDDTAVRAALERIVTPLGRRIDESSPIVDARLADGSRVNAIIPPLALRGPCITIRKFPTQRLTLERLVELGTLSEAMASFLARAVRARVNLVIAGGTGSGKTTLLNVLSSAIPERERVVTIEDAAELSLAQPHVVALESRPANMEGAGAIGIRELVKNALRMRPDRILVGECRGGEALDMLQAMNTGHAGSMTTTHANSPRETLQRLETLCLMAGLDLPLLAVRRQLASSIELVVQQARFSDGLRRVTAITELAGLDERDELQLRDLFRFEPTGLDAAGHCVGEFVATGFIPRCTGRLGRSLPNGGGPWR